jgi:hypothetical protein
MREAEVRGQHTWHQDDVIKNFFHLPRGVNLLIKSMPLTVSRLLLLLLG